jgi:tetratricopeptide (TPR) repeat protein
MSAFDRGLRVFPVSAALLSGLLASMAGSDSDSVSAQESPVTGSSFSSTTSVHDDKHVRNAVLQHSEGEARPLGEIQRSWTAAQGKAPSRSKDVVSLKSADAQPDMSVAKNRRRKAEALSRLRPVIMVSAGRPAIPPVPEPVRENAPPEDLNAVERAPVEPSPAPDQSAVASTIPEMPALEPPVAEATPTQQPAEIMLPPVDTGPETSPANTEQKVLSASQRLKLALEAERRRALAERAVPNEQTPELPSLDGGSIDLAPVEDMPVQDLPLEQLPSQFDLPESSEIPTDDAETGLLDERARRFVRLKQQLMQLKSQLEQPDTANESDQQPLMGDDENTDPQQNHSASDHESGRDGHTEEFLPPVDGHDAHNSELPEKDGDGPEQHESGASPHDTSAHGASSDSATEHSTAPHGHRAVEHEAAADSHVAVPSHDEAAAGEHSASGNAAHVASEHAVVHGTIDRLGLANNLYAVGEYELALDMYEKIDMAELTAQQQIWADYQMANCLRRMGRSSEASNRYRRIAEQPESGWLSEQSRWWVDVLEQIRQLQSSLEENPENPEENLQSPFQGVPRDGKSAESNKSGSMKPRSTEPGNTDHPSSANTKSKHNASSTSASGQTSSRTAKPSKERITHFAPVEKEPKHGEH